MRCSANLDKDTENMSEGDKKLGATASMTISVFQSHKLSPTGMTLSSSFGFFADHTVVRWNTPGILVTCRRAMGQRWDAATDRKHSSPIELHDHSNAPGVPDACAPLQGAVPSTSCSSLT